MIRMSLIRTGATTSNLQRLWDEAVPAVIAELREAGYSVDQDSRAEAVDLDRWQHAYSVEPGPAVLSATAFDSDSGIIWIDLHGDRFCGEGYFDRNNDSALWDRLEALAGRISSAHRVVADVGDPDIVIGVPGAPGTYLPDIPGMPGRRVDDG